MTGGLRYEVHRMPEGMREKLVAQVLEKVSAGAGSPDPFGPEKQEAQWEDCILPENKDTGKGGIQMNEITYEQRKAVYIRALCTYGDRAQMIVAVEELAECQQAICKILRGGENFDHLAEEIADATIMLEQMRLLFNVNDTVCAYMDEKVARLDRRLEGRNR